MNLDSSIKRSNYQRYALCLLASLVPAAPVGFFVMAIASGAFIRLESISVFGLWAGVVIGTAIAAPSFWVFMNLSSRNGSLGFARVTFIAVLSSIGLALLGQLAAATDWLTDYLAFLLWLVAMLTLGYLPFAGEEAS